MTEDTEEETARLDLDKLAPYVGTTGNGKLIAPNVSNLRGFFDIRARQDKKQKDCTMWEGRPFGMMMTRIETAIKLEKVMAFIVESGISPDELMNYVQTKEDKANPDRRRRMRQVITNFLRRAIKGAYPHVSMYKYFRDSDDVQEYGDSCLCLPALGVFCCMRSRVRQLEIAMVAAHCGVRLPRELQDQVDYTWSLAVAEQKRKQRLARVFEFLNHKG
eukprot:s3212_g8.t1